MVSHENPVEMIDLALKQFSHVGPQSIPHPLGLIASPRDLRVDESDRAFAEVNDRQPFRHTDLGCSDSPPDSSLFTKARQRRREISHFAGKVGVVGVDWRTDRREQRIPWL